MQLNEGKSTRLERCYRNRIRGPSPHEHTCDFNTLDTWLNHLKRRLRLGSKNDQSINQKEENHLLAAGSGKEGRWLSPSMQHTQEAE